MLAEALEQVEILTDQRPELAVVDRGYRGHGVEVKASLYGEIVGIDGQDQVRQHWHRLNETTCGEQQNKVSKLVDDIAAGLRFSDDVQLRGVGEHSLGGKLFRASSRLALRSDAISAAL